MCKGLEESSAHCAAQEHQQLTFYLLPRGANEQESVRPHHLDLQSLFLYHRIKMAEEDVVAPVEEEPMTAVDEVDDSEAVKELDEMFKDRFTENDEAFMEVNNKEEIPPPVITNFLDLKYQRSVKS